MGLPSRWTVQGPQSALPQPNLVAVMPRTSRSTQRMGVSPSTSTLCVFSLTLMVKAMASSPFYQRHTSHGCNETRRVKANPLDDGIGDTLASVGTDDDSQRRGGG